MASNEIVPAVQAEVIPSSEMTGLELSLSDLQKFSIDQLPELKRQAEAITVINTADECKQAKEVLAQIRSAKKIGGFKIDPFLEIANKVTKFLRNKRTAHEEECDKLDAPLVRKIKDYDDRERAAALAEETRINNERIQKAKDEAAAKLKADQEKAEEDRKKREKEIEDARKSGDIGKRQAETLKKEAAKIEEKVVEQAAVSAQDAVAAVKPIKVKADVPTRAGAVIRRNWEFKIVDASKIPRAFLIPDEQKIGAMVRNTKNKELIESLIPGIEAYLD